MKKKKKKKTPRLIMFSLHKIARNTYRYQKWELFIRYGRVITLKNYLCSLHQRLCSEFIVIGSKESNVRSVLSSARTAYIFSDHVPWTKPPVALRSECMWVLVGDYITRMMSHVRNMHQWRTTAGHKRMNKIARPVLRIRESLLPDTVTPNWNNLPLVRLLIPIITSIEHIYIYIYIYIVKYSIYSRNIVKYSIYSKNVAKYSIYSRNIVKYSIYSRNIVKYI